MLTFLSESLIDSSFNPDYILQNVLEFLELSESSNFRIMVRVKHMLEVHNHLEINYLKGIKYMDYKS